MKSVALRAPCFTPAQAHLSPGALIATAWRSTARCASAMKSVARALLAFGLALSAGSPVAADGGVDADTITFGQSACFTGPNGNLGLHYRAGILAAFGVQNQRGGVKGKSIELLALDDGYEPERAAANTERFVSEDDVFAVIGGVGTPTARRIAPVLRTANVPFIGHVTGADFLRDAERFPNVVNLRAGYADETRRLVKHVIEELGKRRFGVIYQDDAFGRSVLRNYKAVLDDYSIPILAKAVFSRNTHAVHAGLFSLAKADLDAILIVGTYATNAEIINTANALGHDYIMANLSFVLSDELRKRVDEPSARILVTEVMPDAKERGSQFVESFWRDLEAQYGAPGAADLRNEVALEGYLLGRFITAVLERMEQPWSREGFLATAMTSGPVAIDDWIVQFAPGTNTGSNYTRLIDFGGYDSTRGELELEEG